MTTPATRSRQNTRARLLDAAAEVFAEVGLEGATVEAVCERAGFTRGAFYSNFESMDQLFLTLAASVGEARVRSVRDRITTMVAAGALSDCDPIELVQQVMDSGDDDRLDVLLMSEIRIRALRDRDFGRAYLAQEGELVDSIADIIHEIVDSGQFALRVEVPVAAQLLMTVWETTTVRGVMTGADEADLRGAGSEALGRVVELLKAGGSAP